MKMLSLKKLTLISLAVFPAFGFAQNEIQNIEATSSPDGEVIRIQLSEPLNEIPKGFIIQNPPRIALDLNDVANGLGRSGQEINSTGIRSVSVAESNKKSRLVLNLKKSASYEARLDGNNLLVILTGSNNASGAKASSENAKFSDSLNNSQEQIGNLDFRRGSDGAGRVIVDLPSNQIGVDIKQQGKGLVVEFQRSVAAEKLLKRLDVTDFGTPIQSISTSQVGNKVRMVIEPKGNWEHSAYQSDNQFVVEVRNQKVDANKLTKGVGYTGEKLSLNFQNIEVRSLLQVIAEFTNFNIVTSDTVNGSVTLRLKDVPWDQALDIILQAKNLGMKKNGNVLLIAPKDELAAKEKADLEAKAQVQQLEVLRTQSFQLNYAKAEDVAKAISGDGATGGAGAKTSILSARGSVISDARTNQMIVNDVTSKLEEVQALISKIDIPVRQVMIEARIVEADDTFGKALGIKLGQTDLRGVRGGTPGWSVGGDNRVAISGNSTGIGATTLQDGTSSAGSVYSNGNFVNFPAAGVAGNVASVALSLFGAASNRFLNLELSALETEGKGKIVSSPRVITADQVRALIEQGTEFPYQTATSSGATSIAFRKAALKLDVRPQITPEGAIILDVDVSKDSRGETTSAGIAINTKHIQTQVLVENGGTVVIGGIFLQEETNDVNKVPVLGDIPYLGALFRNKTNTSTKREMLVFLTPKIISERNLSN